MGTCRDLIEIIGAINAHYDGVISLNKLNIIACNIALKYPDFAIPEAPPTSAPTMTITEHLEEAIEDIVNKNPDMAITEIHRALIKLGARKKEIVA